MNVISSFLQPKCPNCQGGLSFTHNKVITFLSCNGKCKETFELHSAEDMVKFFEAVPEQRETELICDGCNVRSPFEHRCHGSRSVVAGEFTNLPCECLECKEPPAPVMSTAAPESYKPAERAEPLSYEQEIHSLLCAAASNTENLLEYFQVQAANEKGEAKKLTHKCIAWKREQLRRIREIIPKALAAKNKPAATPVTVEASEPQIEKAKEEQ